MTTFTFNVSGGNTIGRVAPRMVRGTVTIDVDGDAFTDEQKRRGGIAALSVSQERLIEQMLEGVADEIRQRLNRCFPPLVRQDPES
jgi:hypothetical protein